MRSLRVVAFWATTLLLGAAPAAADEAEATQTAPTRGESTDARGGGSQGGSGRPRAETTTLGEISASVTDGTPTGTDGTDEPEVKTLGDIVLYHEGPPPEGSGEREATEGEVGER